MARGPRPAQPPSSPRPSKRSASEAGNHDAALGTRSKRSRHGPRPTYKEVPEAEEEEDIAVTPSTRRRKIKVEIANGDSAVSESLEEEVRLPATSPTAKKVKKVKAEALEAAQVQNKAKIDSGSPVEQKKKKAKSTVHRAETEQDEPPTSKKASKVTASKADKDANNEDGTKEKRRRKTKEEKEAEAMPIAARTLGSRLFVGAHVSAAGGVHNSIANSLHIGGNAFALFQKSQRKWDNPSIKQEHADQFKTLCASHGYAAASHVVPHGSYLVNLAARDPAKATQAYDSFLDDVRRSESLGIKLYNFHPGNTNGEPRAEAIGRIAQRLNAAHKATSSVVTLLENMAASPEGNTVGGRFEDLAAVIDLVDDKARVGVCLDTCHTFAAGYDLRSPAAFAETMAAFGRIVGFEYLRAVHMNDSKAPLGAHRDLHQNIGCGFLGLRAFHNLVNDPRFAGMPLILETPIDTKDDKGKSVEDRGVWAREIKLLESLVDMDPSGDEYLRLEKELADKGAEERAKYQEKFEKKQDKLVKDAKKKGSKAKATESAEDSDGEDA